MHFGMNHHPYRYDTQHNYQSHYPYQPSMHIGIHSYPSYNEPGYQTPYEYFQKPEQPTSWPMNGNSEVNSYVNTNEYPQMKQQQPDLNGLPLNASPKPTVMNHFQKEDGQLDLDKVLSTVGQLASTYHQVYPIIQQVNGLLKAFRAGT